MVSVLLSKAFALCPFSLLRLPESWSSLFHFWVTGLLPSSSTLSSSPFPPFLALSNLIRLAVGVFFLKMQLIILLLLKVPLSWLFGTSPLHHLAFVSFSFVLIFPPSIHFLSAHLRFLCCCCCQLFYALSHLQTFYINYSSEYLPLGSLAASHPLPALHPQLILWHG